MTDTKTPKRGYISSTSELESSIDNSNTSTPQTNPEGKKEKKLTKSQKAKKAKTEQKETELKLDMSSISMDSELKQINEKLSNMLTKSDKTFIKNMIKDTILEIKDSLLAPVIKRVEILESELHDKEIENEKLKKDLNALTDTLDKKQEQITEIKKSIKTESTTRAEQINNHEQYSRVNNIRITALPGDNRNESSYETTQKVLQMFNDNLKVNMPFQEVDIAHRLGQYKEGQNRHARKGLLGLTNRMAMERTYKYVFCKQDESEVCSKAMPFV